jgi:hypothetical protein
MAQRKPPPPSKSAAKKGPSRPAGKPTGGQSARANTAKPAAKGAPSRPPSRKGKSIVNQKQTPWGMIISALAVVAFAAAVVIVVVVTHKSSNSSASGNGGCSQMIGNNSTSYLNELKCAKDIKGVTFKAEPNRNHVEGVIQYDATPPVGGNHSQYWADCTGTVYAKPIASENAVHMLEHGAVWITYNAKTLPGSQLSKLTGYVAGVDRMALSPYPNLKTPISLQSWGYQLFVNKASDPRIAKFISALKYNPQTTPEYGASCSQPTFKDHPSTFGHPLWTPASGSASGAVMSGAP